MLSKVNRLFLMKTKSNFIDKINSLKKSTKTAYFDTTKKN